MKKEPRILGKARVKSARGVVVDGRLYKRGSLCPIYKEQVDTIAKMYKFFVWDTLPYEVKEKVVSSWG